MRPLYDKVHQYMVKTDSRFHTPGHSGQSMSAIYSAAPFDLTEIDGLDNLLNPEGVILESEQLLAKSYKCKYSLMLTTGSTTGMHIAIKAIAQKGKELACLGSMHKSFYGGCMFQGMKIHEYDSIEKLEKYLKKKNNIVAIFTTSPDYFGMVKNLKKLRELADKNKSYLVVDGAHSAHFPYSSLLPENPSSIADITIVSMHKTLPVYGGGAIINCNCDELYRPLMFFRLVIHSSSPSYLIMASMDFARDYAEKFGEQEYKKVYDKIKSYKGKMGPFKILPTDDFSRLVLQKRGADAHDIKKQLSQKDINIEMAFEDKLVLIVTPSNYVFLDKLKKELMDVNITKSNVVSPKIRCNKARNFAKAELAFVDIKDCGGMIAATEIGIYPPGVPIVSYKDIISDEVVAYMTENREYIFGLVDGKVPVLKVDKE